MFTEMILDKLGKYYDDEAKKAHGNTPSISYGVFISRILEDRGNSASYTLFPEIAVQTFNRMMKKCFPSIKLNGGNHNWCFYLLSLIEHKNCGQCSTIKSFSEFHKDKNNSRLGLCSLCKSCVSANQSGQYSRYFESHQKSYEVHAGKIKARRQLYSGERAKRIPTWYPDQKSQIEEFYNNCPSGYHVDHIIPLKGELVSGLHVLNNLQYLTAEENMRKGNRYLLE